MKNTHDYDSTFKTLKNRHTRLFIAVINLAFHKNYPLNAEVRIISSEGAFIDEAKPDDKSKVEMRENDFLISINDGYRPYGGNLTANPTIERCELSSRL